MKIAIGVISFMSLVLGLLIDVGRPTHPSMIYSGSFYVMFMIGMCAIYIVETVKSDREPKAKKK